MDIFKALEELESQEKQQNLNESDPSQTKSFKKKAQRAGN